MNLHTTFLETAAAEPGRAAIFYGDDSCTYGHLADQSARVAAALAGPLGVRPGERVGIWLRNCPEFIGALFGILRMGAVAVPINNFLKAEEVAYHLSDAGIRVLISEDELLAAFDGAGDDRPQFRPLRREAFRDLPGVASAPTVDAGGEDLAVLIYTSGTTGRPKGAMLTHDNLLHNVASCRTILEITEADRLAVLLPMFHSFMLTVGLLLPLTSGAAVVLIKSLHPPKSVMAEVIQHQATVLPAIPQFFRALAAAPAPEGLALRACVSGAAPLPVETLEAFNRRYPLPVIEGYGLSEASPVVSLNPLRGVQKPGSIGLPIPGVEISIRDEAGRALPVGETGEVCVRGGNVMRGYWNNPEATAATLRDGWLYTGDMGHLDADGYAYITDRKKDMLLVNGINVYPREIEEVLHRFPGLGEAAVVGRQDSRKGERPVAWVTLEAGVDLDVAAIRAFLREHLADYKVPREIHALPALPRNGTGKVLKTKLREMTVT